MARDYKNSTPKKTTRKKTKKKTSKKTGKKSSTSAVTRKGLPAWLWFIVGMLVMFTAQYFYKQNFEEVNNDNSSETIVPYTSRDNSSDNTNSDENISESPQNDEVKITKDPRFTFYEQLPKDEVIIPEEALIDVDKNKTELKEPLEDVAKAGTYYLQAGSFKDFADADRRKAELALFGLQTSIQKVAINTVNWYRVRIGPISDLETLNLTRQELRNSGVDVLVIRVSD